MEIPSEKDAFTRCRAIAREHEENFPVASLLIPRAHRAHVAALYAFARTADDFADEGTLTPGERLALLRDWEEQLRACYRGEARHPVFVALRATIRATGIPQELPEALLRAFRADVTRTRYATLDELLGYCADSANPVGRLVLQIFGMSTRETTVFSDRICTALQLTNFWQDISQDRDRGRIYLPLEDMRRFGYTEEDLLRGVADDRFRALLRFQVERTRRLFASGAPLIRCCRGRLRMELAATLQGGRAILDGIERIGYDTLSRRVVLRRTDILVMLREALRWV
jgi:squalene synthase HpnC